MYVRTHAIITTGSLLVYQVIKTKQKKKHSYMDLWKLVNKLWKPMVSFSLFQANRWWGAAHFFSIRIRHPQISGPRFTDTPPE